MGHYHNSRSTTDGIILCHDAANLQSYRGTGTVVNSLINVFNATLTNGVTFSTDSRGAFVFNGTNQYNLIANSTPLQLSTGSFSVWAKASSPGAGFRGIIAKQFSHGVFYDNGVLVSYDWGANATRSTGINLTNASLRIGMDMSGFGMSGQIARVNFYDKALSDKEIFKSYVNYKSRFGL